MAMQKDAELIRQKSNRRQRNYKSKRIKIKNQLSDSDILKIINYLED